MPDPPTPQPPTTGPSRDMFGGPWLGVLVFLVIAIGLGWGAIGLFQQMLGQSIQHSTDNAMDHGFDADAVYLTQRPMLLGYSSNGTPTLVPGKADLPSHAPGRRRWTSIEEARAMSEQALDDRDLAGIVERNTRVRFVEVIDNPSHQQTRLLVRVEILDGKHASPTPVLGLHLESTDIDQETGSRRYDPRPDLFEQAQQAKTPVQSPARDNAAAPSP